MTQVEWWETRRVQTLAILLVAIPLLWPKIPPLVDVPNHMASYHISLTLARSPDLQRYFGFQWEMIGNLGVNLLVVPVAQLFGVEMGTKLIVLLIPILTALGMILVAAQGHRRIPATAFAALPLVYAWPMMFGFVNYCLSVALAFLGLALWLFLAERERWRVRFVSFVFISSFCWLAHAIGWMMLCAMCGAAELNRQLRQQSSGVRALSTSGLNCLSLLAPFVLIALNPHERGANPGYFFDWGALLKMSGEILYDRWFSFDIVSALCLAALLGAASLGWIGLRLRPTLGWPAVGLFILYILLPQNMNGAVALSFRIAPYAAAMALLAIDTDEVSMHKRQILAVAASAFLALRLAGNTVSLALFDKSYNRELKAVDHIPRGAAVLTFSTLSCDMTLDSWLGRRLYHLPGLAVVRRDAFMNGTWSVSGLHTLSVHYAAAGPFQSDPSNFVFGQRCPPGNPNLTLAEALRIAPWSAFDQLWLVGIPRNNWPNDPRLTAIWSSDSSVLYNVKHDKRLT